ncbi:MAG: hypothetical protein MJ177_10240 [Clostridia bacterium]|nr:hypothetical protein [Clostridia bacterium]
MDMDSLASVLGSLSDEDISSLKSIAQSFMAEEKNGEDDPQNEDGTDTQTLGKIMSLMGSLNSGSDERTALIRSLKPFLSEERRKKADEAARMMKMLELLPAMKDILGIF